MADQAKETPRQSGGTGGALTEERVREIVREELTVLLDQNAARSRERTERMLRRLVDELSALDADARPS